MKLAGRIMTVGVCLMLLGCRSLAATKAENAHGSVKLIAVSSDDTTMRLPGVDLSFIAGDGSVQQIGRTGPFGDISISKDILRSKSAIVVLCCHSAFFCGAIRVEEQRLLDYDEYLIALSPVVVR